MLTVLVSQSALAAKVSLKKVLPHFTDAQGRHSLSPSLYERDAYQDFLRSNPDKRGGIRFDVLWRGASKGQNLKLRVEMRGIRDDVVLLETLEKPIQKSGWFASWTSVSLVGPSYKKLGTLSAWRVTLWENDQQISEQKSFLW